jgi:hypothetical protein
MDPMMQAALLSWERTWADGPVVRGKARQLARVRQWLAGVEEPLRVTDTHDYAPLGALLWPGMTATYTSAHIDEENQPLHER